MQLLVELAIERDADIPALVYEARPTVSPSLECLGGGIGRLKAGHLGA